jgi:NACHT domain-containing protein
MTSGSRVLALVLRGGRYVEDHTFRTAPERDAMTYVNSATAAYLARYCDLDEREVELRGARGRAPVYVTRTEPDRGYIVVPSGDYDDFTAPDALTDTLAEFVHVTSGRVSTFDHEHSAGRARDIRMHFVRPRLEPCSPGEPAGRHVEWDELKDVTHAVILGEPGAGKTSLLRRLAADYTDAFVDRGVGVLPLYVQLRQVSRKGASLRTLADVSALGGFDPHIELADTSRDLVLLLDGLDEIVDSDRDVVANDIKALINRNPRIKVIISSRSVGYRGAFSEFREFRLLPFNVDQRNEWVWLSEPDPAVWTEFVTQLEQNRDIAQLVANPLLLSITFYLYQTKALVPRERAGIAEYWVRALSDDWDRERRVQRTQLWSNPRAIFAYLCRLAYDLNVRNEDVFYLHDAVPLASRVFDVEDSDGAFRALAERSGLLAPSGDGGWTFTHLVIRDYLAGEYIAAGEPNAAGFVKGHLESTRRRSTWLYACGAALQADSLVNEHLAPVENVTIEDAALLVNSLRQDPEVVAAVVAAGADLIRAVLERELGGAHLEYLKEGEKGEDEHVAFVVSENALTLLVQAILGSRGAAFGSALSTSFESSQVPVLVVIGRALEAAHPLTVEVAQAGSAWRLRMRRSEPDGLPVEWRPTTQQ